MITRRPLAAFASAVLLSAPFSLTSVLHAAPGNAYQGPGAGDWNTPANWSTGAVPNGVGGTYYDVTNTSANGVLHASSLGPNGVDTINSLIFTGTGGLTLSGGILAGSQANDASIFSVSGPLLIKGGSLRNFTLMNSDAATFGSSGTSDGNTLDSMTLSGGLKIASSGVNISGRFAYGAGATFDLSASGIIGFQINETLANATLKQGGYSSLVSVDSSHTLTLDKTLTVTGLNAAFNGGTVISNTLLSSSSGGQWRITPSNFTNNATVEARNSGSVLTINGGAFYNTGVFQAVGGSASAQTTTFVNTGTIQALGGGSITLSPYTYTYNSNALGTVTASGTGSTVNLAGGTLVLGRGENLSATGGGRINLETTLDNTGRTFDPLAYGVPGSFAVNNGTVTGGAIANSGSLSFVGTDVLQNVVLSDGLSLAGAASTVQVQGTFGHGAGAAFNLGTGSTLTFVGNQTFDNASVNFGSSSAALGSASGTLTLGPNLVLQGGQGIIGPYVGAGGKLVNQTTIAASGSSPNFGLNTFSIQTYQATNQGTLQADHGGYFVISSSTAFTNAGTVTVTAGSTMATPGFVQTAGQTTDDGQMNVSTSGGLVLQGGSLSGTGNLGGGVTNTGGTVKPGDPTGILTLLTTYTQGGGGTFLEQLGGTGTGQYGVLKPGGAASLAGTLDVSLVNGFSPSVGQTFTFLNAASLSGAFTSVVGLDAGYGYSVAYGANSATLTVTSVAAPEPSQAFALALGALGMAGLALKARRPHRP